MKTLSIAIAALAAAGGLTMPAQAQHTVVTRHTVTRVTTHHPVSHYRNVCRTEWRHHHKVRVCHRVRY